MDAAGGEREGRAVPRPWCVPPAIQRDPGDKLEGDHVLSRLPDILFTSTIHFRAVWETCRRE
jgi:hypothetical protein